MNMRYVDSPQLPWRERRVLLAQKIAGRGESGLPVNIKWNLKTYEDKDLKRFIKEGYGILNHKNTPVHWTLDKTGKGHQNYKTVSLTELGNKLLPKLEVKRVAEPYAKRNAEMKKMKPF